MLETEGEIENILYRLIHDCQGSAGFIVKLLVRKNPILYCLGLDITPT